MADTYLFGFKGIVDTLIWQDFAETHPNNGSFPIQPANPQCPQSSKAQDEGVSIANASATCRAHGESHLPGVHGETSPKSPWNMSNMLAILGYVQRKFRGRNFRVTDFWNVRERVRQRKS